MTRSNKLLVLDLDETLIYASEEPLGRDADFLAGPYHVYRRPFVREFLTGVSGLFDLGVWTSSSAEFAAAIVEQLFIGLPQPAIVWSRERCTRRLDEASLEYVWLKDLAKLKRRGYRLEQVIMVDDTSAKLARNYGNLVSVRSWEGDLRDRELPLLLRYLNSLRGVENVRTVDKRGWRNT